MNNLMEYKGYHAKIEYSSEDETFIGHIVGINDVLSFDGENIEELKSSFHESIDEYLQMCKEIGKAPDKEFKGSFNVRISPELHKSAYFEASKQGISLNQYVERAISQSFSPRENTTCFIQIPQNFQFKKYDNDAMNNMSDFSGDQASIYEHEEVVSVER